MTLSLRRSVHAGYGAICAILLAIAATSHFALERYRLHAEQEGRTREVRAHLQDARTALLEGLLRARPAAGGPEANAGRLLGASRFAAEVDWLRALTADNASQQARLGAIEADLRQRAPDIVDRLIGQLDAMDQEELRLLDARRRATTRSGELAAVTILLGVSVALLAALVMGWLSGRRIARLVDRLEHGFAAVERGELGHRIRHGDGEGTEQRRLAHGFNAMAARLHDLIDRSERSRAAMRQVFDASATAYVLVRADGSIALTNALACQLFGWPAAVLERMRLDELVPPEHRTVHASMVRNFFRKPAARDMGSGRLIEAVHASGRRLRVEVALTALQFEGEPCVLASVLDVSARQQREAELVEARARAEQAHARTREALERAALMTEAAGLGTWFFDMGDGSLVVDERYAAMLGETVESFGRHADDFNRRLPPEDRAAVWARVEQHVLGELDNMDVEFRMRHRDGHWVWIASYGRVAKRDAQGRMVALAGTHRDVTELREAQEQRESQRRLLESLSRNVPGVLHRIRIGADGRPVRYDYLGGSAEALFGLPVEKVTPQRILALMEGDEAEGLAESSRRSIEGRIQFDREFGFTRLDGSYRRVRLLSSWAESDGEHQLWDGVFFDVTAEWRLRRETADALRRLEAVTRGAKVATWFWNPKSDSMEVNDRWFEQYGHARGELTPGFRTWGERVHPDDRTGILDRTLAHLAGETHAIRHEARYRHRDGGWRWIRVQGQVVERDAADEPTLVVGVELDVTAEREAAELIEAQQRRLFAMSRNLPVVIHRWVGRPGIVTRIEIVGGPLRDLLGIDDATFEQHGFLPLLLPEDVERCRHAVEAAVASRQPFDFETRIRRGDGAMRWIRVQSTWAGMDGDDWIYDGAITDVTTLREQQAELERANRAKSAFLASMSHEIRTPLNGVIGASNLLADMRLPGEARELVAMQRDAGEALLTVINDILDLSKIEAGRLELDPHPFDLEKLVRRTLEMVRLQAEGKGLTLVAAFPDDFERGVVGDATRIRQVLLNLVTNAVKFTTAGEVRVEVRERSPVDGQRVIGFRVSDTGIGIPPDALARLFVPFTQAGADTTRHFGGTGLGLAICRQLVVHMGGCIGVDSVVGEGSTFRFEIPLARVEPVGADEVTAAEAAGRRADRLIERARLGTRPLDVLLAEDVPVNQIIATRVLERAGHRVTVVDDGVQAVDAVSRRPFDVVLMDMRMPEMDGLEATRRIRALGGRPGRVPIIGLTAEAIREELDRCLAAGMDDTVTKPFDRDELLRKLQAHAAAAVDGPLA